MEIQRNDLKLHFVDTGDKSGTPLIFLHYWGGSTRTWNEVISNLDDRFRKIAIDHRGWGESEGPASGYSLSDMASDAEAVIRELDLNNYIVVGHSMGGKVAQLLASRNTGAVKGLILIASAGPGPTHLPPETRSSMRTTYDSQASIEKVIDHVLSEKKLNADLRAQVIEDSLRGSKEAKLAWPVSTMLEDIREEVKNVEIPILVIAGEADKVDPVEILRSHLLAYFPHAKMAVLAGTGHLAPLESPDETADLIREFVSSNPEVTSKTKTTNTADANKELVLAGIKGVFIDRDPSVLDRLFSDDYRQHNPQIPNGPAAIKGLLGKLPPSFKYEPGLVVADGDYVAIHGRYIGWGPKPMIAVDIFRVANGKIAEHWDVMQEEVPATQSVNGNTMLTV